MTPQISIHEAAHRLHKSDEETFTLLKNGAFAGDAEAKFPTVDPLSLDTYIQNNRHPAQLPLIPPDPADIAARTAWSEEEEQVIRDCADRYAAIAEYRFWFTGSDRTDYAVGKHWYRMRSRKPEKAGGIWSWICSLFRKAAGG